MKTELLAPAGSVEGMHAAVAAGADAVYMGGSLFGARAYAKNPAGEELKEAIDYVHLHGKKLYLTVNTLLKNRELQEQLYEYLAPFYERGLDAVIVQDLGVLEFIRKEFPELPVHASTQMAVTGAKGAGLLKESGVSRIVTARELSLEEIRHIHDTTGVEIESFIHGALCYSYSGMCLFSSMLGGRSGNRGRCAQPCRLPYQVFGEGKRTGSRKEEYPLSLKDMCTIEILPEILEAGVYSLKIEGRMKKPEYAAGVTRIYRKYLDRYAENPQNYHVEKEDKEELLELYQRDGFSTGYYKQHNGREMVAIQNLKQQENKEKGVRTRNEFLFENLKKEYTDKKLQEKIYGSLILYAGSPAILDLEYGEHHVQVQGNVVEQAMKQPLSEERLRRQVEKTGNTPYVFEQLDIQTDGQGFLSMQSLNELRRDGISALKQACLQPYFRKLPERQQVGTEERKKKREPEGKTQTDVQLYVSAETWDQIKEAAARTEIDGICFDLSLVWGDSLQEKIRYTAEFIHGSGKECYLAMPYVLRKNILEQAEEALCRTTDCVDGFLVRNLESLAFMKEKNLLHKAVCDFGLYSMNDTAKDFLEHLGVKRTTIPLELNEGEIRGRNPDDSELLVYGYYPMMISAQCLKKTYNKCRKESGIMQLRDRYGNEFLTKTVCPFCYNVIYNSIPAGLLSERDRIYKMNIRHLRMNFTTEGRAETGQILDLFLDVYKKKKKIPDEIPAFTKGHFRRGVE
ncbi:MAG: DUF3656 domain-containing protein [Blautia sp.]